METLLKVLDVIKEIDTYKLLILVIAILVVFYFLKDFIVKFLSKKFNLNEVKSFGEYVAKKSEENKSKRIKISIDDMLNKWINIK